MLEHPLVGGVVAHDGGRLRVSDAFRHVAHGPVDREFSPTRVGELAEVAVRVVGPGVAVVGACRGVYVGRVVVGVGAGRRARRHAADLVVGVVPVPGRVAGGDRDEAPEVVVLVVLQQRGRRGLRPDDGLGLDDGFDLRVGVVLVLRAVERRRAGDFRASSQCRVASYERLSTTLLLCSSRVSCPSAVYERSLAYRVVVWTAVGSCPVRETGGPRCRRRERRARTAG